MPYIQSGYLELNYHERPYLAGDMFFSNGVQVEKIIDVDYEMGSQVEKFIKPKDNLGSQILRLIKISDSLGSQVNKLMVDPPDDMNILTQIEKVIDTDLGLGIQTNKLMVDPPDDINLGVQVNKNIIDPPNDIYLGLQIEKILAPVFDGGIKTQVLKYLDKTVSIGSQIERFIIDPPKDVEMGLQIEKFIESIDDYGVQIFKTNLLHIPCRYYLNTYGYMTHSYLAGCMGATLPVQIDKGIYSVRNNVGAQTNREIIDPPEDVYLNVQVDKKIEEAEAIIGSQIEKVLTYLLVGPSQVEKFLSYSVYHATQIHRTIDFLRPFGVQITKTFANEMAVQIFKRLYNITQLRILDYFLNRGTIAQGGITWTNEIPDGIALGDYNVNNLNTDIIEEVTKTAPSERRFKIYCNTGIPNTFVDTIAILNHNFTASAIIDITGFTDLSSFNAGIPSVVIRPIVSRENIIWINPEVPLFPCQYWRFDIQDVGNPYQLQMGVIVFGSSRIMTTLECFDNPVTFGYKHYKDSVETEGFTNYSLDRAMRRNLSLSFSKLRYYGGNFLMLQDYFLGVKTDLKALIIPRPTKPNSMAVFAKLNQLPVESHEAIDDENHYVSFSCDWDEAN